MERPSGLVLRSQIPAILLDAINLMLEDLSPVRGGRGRADEQMRIVHVLCDGDGAVGIGHDDRDAVDAAVVRLCERARGEQRRAEEIASPGAPGLREQLQRESVHGGVVRLRDAEHERACQVVGSRVDPAGPDAAVGAAGGDGGYVWDREGEGEQREEGEGGLHVCERWMDVV